MSEASSASAIVAARRSAATRLGERLAELTGEPEVFVAELQAGLAALSDAAYIATLERVSPDVPARIAVRGPLMRAIEAPLVVALGEGSAATALSLAQRLGQADEREVRVFARACLERTIGEDPERTWQLLRRLGRRAGDWIEIDAMAGLWARGVLAEPFRWAELEQIVYSARPMERRIVGATLACMTHALPASRRAILVGGPSGQAYALIGTLIGDADPRVQKSLSWAIREWARLDPAGATRLVRDEAAIAVERADGHRAWVIRDALAALDPTEAAGLRARLAPIRRTAAAPSSSLAASRAAAFAPAMPGADDAVDQQGERYTRSHA